MSDYGSLYAIDSSYNSDRDAYEVTFGYLEKDKEVKGRYVSIRIVVNVADHRGEEAEVKELALGKARELLGKASKALLQEE